MAKLWNETDLDAYYKRLNIALPLSSMWNALQSKSEYKSDKSELGYQLVAKSMAGNIARAVGADSDKAEVLTMCAGVFFPAKGTAGKRFIREFLQKRNINTSIGDLSKNFIEYQIEQKVWETVSTDLDSSLTELFSSPTTTTPEVRIARLCQSIIHDVKRLESVSTIGATDLLYSISEDTIQACETAKRPVRSPKLEQLLTALPEDVARPVMTAEEKEQEAATLQEFIDFEKDTLSGVYSYIGASDFSR